MLKKIIAASCIVGGIYIGLWGTGNAPSTFEKELLKAHKGERRSMVKVGRMYDKGVVVDEDNSQAVEWFSQAIDAGEPDAYVFLGDMYVKGEGVPKSYEKAVSLYEQAMKVGNIRAKTSMARMYFFGLGVENDYKKGLELLEEAAKIGETIAIHTLGDIERRNGRHKEAIELYKKAAQFGDENGYMKWGVLCLEDKKDYKQAYELFLKAAEMESTSAMLYLASMYQEGKYVEKNSETELAWCKKAADLGDAGAIRFLAEAYKEGTKNIVANKEKADYWHERMGRKDTVQVLRKVGRYYYRKAEQASGEEMREAYDRCIYWLTKSIKKEDNKEDRELLGKIHDGVGYSVLNKAENKRAAFVMYDALLRMAENDELYHDRIKYSTIIANYYEQGEGVEQDYHKAIYYLEKIADIDKNAAKRLGDIYMHGNEQIEKNLFKAEHYYEKSRKNSQESVYTNEILNMKE